MGVFATANSPSGIHSKSTDKLKSMMSFREGAADDREEGEIIDEYEDIISSDEEFSMRQRIEELEAKNAELEKIANISAIYASGNYDYTKKDSSSHHVDRYPLISIDISDEEDYPPPPSMTRITKRRKSLEHSSSRRKILHTTSNSGHRRRKKSSSPPPAPPYRQSDKMLLSMFHEKYAVRSSSKKRRKNKKSHRKVREYQYVSDDYTLDNYNLDVIDGYENYNSSDADGNFSINRDELRLALARNTHRHEQHVSLKDRLIRRKENTDTLNEKSVGDNQEIAEVEDNSDGPQYKADADAEAEDNMEEQELRIIALKSAVIRKHMVRKKRNENVAYSPSDFDEAYANISASPSINIDDAEPCMEISPVPSPKIVISDDDEIDTKPVDMDIVHSDSECELSYEKWVPIEQIPLPNNMVIQDELYVPTPLRYNTNVDRQHYMPPDVRYETALDSPANLDSDVEEEELALRALLLAKMNSPKVNKHVIEERPKIEEMHSPDADTSLEAEALRDFLISNMKKKTQQQNSSASVLKEAVRRLTARNTNSSPLESFAELSSIQGRCESVSAFSMTLHDAENQLSQSTADLAKIQIGQPGMKANNVGQGWTLWDTDEGYSEVKFHLSPKKIKVEPNEESCVVNSHFERLANGVKREEVDQKGLKSPKHELKAESKSLTVNLDESKKADGAKNEKRDKESGSLAKLVSAEYSKSPEVEEDGREPSVVHVSASENENQADVEVNAKERTVDEEKIEQDSTVEREETSVPEVKESDTEVPKTTSSVSSLGGEGLLQDSSTETTIQAEKNVAEVEKDTQSRPKTITSIPLSTDGDLMKDITTEPSVHPEKNVAEVKKDTQKRAMVKSSSATSSVVEVKTTEINESSTPTVSDTNVKTCVTTVDPKPVKSLDVVGQASIEPAEINSAPVPTQKKIAAAAKKNPVPSISKVAKSLATSQKSVPQQKKVASSAPPEVKKESSSNVAKGGKENTNSSAVKPEKQITEQLFTAKSLPLAQSAQKPHPKPSVQQSTKIVKPNKVINTRVTDLKRAPSENIAVPAKIAKLDDSSNRLITTAEMPQVKKLVIQLRASDTESDYSALSADGDDDDDDLDARDRDFINRSITIGNEYYDIASPISLPMESPCDTPTRTASPIASVTPQPIVEKCIENDFFQAQLDKFLKNVRSKVAESSKQPVDVEESAPPAVSTPVAVRHLPEASQQEYRRLINRMKMLERQKQAKNLQVIVKNTNALTSAEARTVMGDGESLVRKVLVKNASVNTAKPTCQVKIPQNQVSKTLLVVGKTVPQMPPEGGQKPTTPEKEGKAISAVVLPRKIPPRLAPSTSGAALPATSPPKTTSVSAKSIPPSTTKPGPPTTPKQSNQKLLVLYEKTYRETGNSIISNLDRSIEMVTVAKKAKMEKLKYEHRLMELRKEMEDVQRHIRQHQERITKIYPEICNSHRMIETLKTRRVKIHKDVTVFGKRVIGQSYSMNNDQKPIISEKSKKLAAEIKLVNNMKLSDVEKWQGLTQPSRTDTAAIVIAPVQVPVIENDSLICKAPAHDTVPVDDSKTNAIETSLPEATSRIEPELTHTVVPERILNEPKKGVDQTDQDQTNSTNGHEEALEIERPVGDDKQAHNSKNDEEEEEDKVNRGDEDERVENREVFENEQMGGTKLQDYVSPLGHLRDERQINPNGIVCPYQLMGQCGDKDCKYMHLDN